MARIPLAIPNVGESEAANLRACIDENFVSSVGRFVTEFEDRCASLSGSAHGVATSAGTQALHIALRAMDIGEGDLVILPTYTFIASANAISHANATPWLMDISAEDWTLDPDRVEEALETACEVQDGVCVHIPSGRRVAAMMPVYTLGTPADMNRLRPLAAHYGLAVIADAAAAIGVNIGDSPIGGFADMTCYSFNGNKTITCGGGGMIVGDDATLLTRARHLSTTARVSPNYDHDEVGFNYRMTNVQAAIGCAQLDRLDEFLAAKRRVRAAYDQVFAGIPGVSSFPAPRNRSSTFWFSGLVLDDENARPVAEVCSALMERGVEARPFWKPIHLQRPYADAPAEPTPVADALWSRVVTLPCSTSLSENDQARVIDAVRDVLQHVGQS